MTIPPLAPEVRIASASPNIKAARIRPLPQVEALPPRVALSPIARAPRELAAAPPVDAAKVAALRSQIVAGTYTVDPGKIADRMIALDLPRR